MSRHIKSRTGCRVCKAKRLKCDETVPSCRNCLSRGISCPGYQQVLRWSTKYEAASSPKAKATSIPQFTEFATAASRSIQDSRSQRLAGDEAEQPSPVFSAQSSRSGDQQNQNGQHDHQEREAEADAEADADAEVEMVEQLKSPYSEASYLVFDSASETQSYDYQSEQGSIVSFGGSAAGSPSVVLSPECRSFVAGEEHALVPLPPKYVVESPPRYLSIPGTSLVELWFRSVCGVWAAFDSPSNPFRQLCSELWASDESVFFSLQTMAAASLQNRPSSMNEVIVSAPQMSTQALIYDLQALFKEPDSVTELPGGLLASLFCMSSSLNWIDSRQLGIQYLRNARSVIDLLDLRAKHLSPSDRSLLEFFRGCLIYEEMLRAIVTDDPDNIQSILTWDPSSEDDNYTDLTFHPWVGVPIRLIALLGKVMALCRRSRKLWRRGSRATYELLYQAMEDIKEGKTLEEVLLSTDIRQLRTEDGRPIPETGELPSHLYRAAEAFRLISLLQLYQTFPDLLSQRQTLHGTEYENRSSNQIMVMPLALYIVDIVMSIPANSPMRCLQPLLCLCSGSALRADEPLDPESLLKGLSYLNSKDVPYLPVVSQEAGLLSLHKANIVDSARNAVHERLLKLEKNLPPRPISVIRQLLETIWATFDKEVPPQKSHWLDIMVDSHFESVFG